MTKRLLVVLLLWTALAAAAVREIQSDWAGLGRRISGKHVLLMLPKGETIEGRVTSVSADALAMTVSKTSDPATHPKGAASIPRASVSTIQLLEMRATGRIVGVVAGAAIGLAAAIGVAFSNGILSKETTGQTVAEIALIAGLPVAGYFIGRSLDHKVTLIRVVG